MKILLFLGVPILRHFTVHVLESYCITVIILNIGTDRSEQTVQTQIRLLLMATIFNMQPPVLLKL